MAYQYLFDPNKQFQNVSGVNNVAGFLRVFYNGTDDRAVTYKDFNGTANPADIPIDNNGRAVVIVNEDMVYRLEVYNRDGALLWSQYPLLPMGGGGGSTTTVTSSDGSVSIEKTGDNYDISVKDSLDGAVLYTPQDKTISQKATARDNIDAQHKLTAGANVSIANNVISVGSIYAKSENTYVPDSNYVTIKSYNGEWDSFDIVANDTEIAMVATTGFSRDLYVFLDYSTVNPISVFSNRTSIKNMSNYDMARLEIFGMGIGYEIPRWVYTVYKTPGLYHVYADQEYKVI